MAPLAEGPYANEHDLYDLARRVDWARWITPRETMRVDTTAQPTPLTSINFAALRIKDAMCDALREATGERPSVDTRRPHLAAWREMQAAAKERVHAPAVPVFAGDVAFRMTDFAARNAERAGVRHAIEFKTADALQRPPPAAAGTMVLNPPYGERIGAKGQGSREAFGAGGTPAEFFSALATHWKRHYAGWTAWVLSPEMKLPSLMRLKESRRVPLWNGPIECRLFKFELTAGSNR